VDPFSGEGIGNALDSARVAATVIAEYLQPGSTIDPARAYATRLWDTLDVDELKLHYRLRSLARHSGIIDFLVGRAAAHPDVLDWIRRMTAARGAVASKRSLVSPLTYARLFLRR
jgi:flavin-dependent dehydrogenase